MSSPYGNCCYCFTVVATLASSLILLN
uniref:Uncharacterized protein n=1 Tax=Anguilla anguilla TaxID=7936 RepID=A0A0E9T940_ANGAN